MSEGRDLAKIEIFTAAITSVAGVHLLHRDIGYDANRTVFTFMGAPAAVSLAAKQLAKACVEHIDLRTYSGTHPYVGALDVCPFIPLWGLSPKHALRAAQDLGRYCAEDLGVPVFFYEHSATYRPYRSLARVRRGGLRDLAQRSGERGPSLGEKPHPTAGASVIGARDILVAYNINLTTPNTELAQAIARHIRASNKTTGLAKVRAIGWWQDTFDCAQVSINLRDYRTTGLAEVYERVGSLARAQGSDAAGSELIGLLPLEALVDAGREYAPDEPNMHVLAELAVERLGLGALKPFDAEARVLEYAALRALESTAP